MTTPTYLGEHVHRDFDVSGLAAAFATATESGRAALQARLETPLSDAIAIRGRQAELLSIRSRCKDPAFAEIIQEARACLASNEADCISVGAAAADPRNAEYYTQILWSPTSWFARLNHLGWLNEVIVFFRTLFLPGLSVALPLLIFLAPLIAMNLMGAGDRGSSMTLQQYFGMIQSALKGAMPSVLGKPRFAGRGGAAELGEQFIHIGATIAMFVASIWNQVSAAMTMRGVAADMRRRAEAVRKTTEATGRLAAALGVSVDLGAPWSAGELGLFGDAWNDPSRIHTLMATVGHLDMLAALGTAKRVCFPALGDRIALTDLFHPGLPAAERVYNSLTMDGSGAHVLLTGPNRGGKSTMLKALGSAVLMHQCLGIVFARSATLPLFGSVITALAPTDRLGRLSLFEAEIEFAKDVRARLRETAEPVFLMMDEIFHGTNAHDGVEASQVFLDELYGEAWPCRVFSVVSTHYMELPRRYGPDSGQGTKTQNLCMDAKMDPADPDRLIYSYKLRPGVNQFSSVREILIERGLLSKKLSAPASKV